MQAASPCRRRDLPAGGAGPPIPDVSVPRSCAMMSVDERFYLSRPPPWWVFGILCATVPLILVVTALMAGQTIDWDATTPLVVVCLDLAVASTLAAMHRRRLT